MLSRLLIKSTTRTKKGIEQTIILQERLSLNKITPPNNLLEYNHV